MFYHKSLRIDHFADVKLDQFVIMPDHIHGIIIITKNNLQNRRGWACQILTNLPRKYGKPIPGLLSTIIGSFKSPMKNKTNKLRNSPGIPVRQRNYYEHIIRNEKELLEIRKYVLDNQINWGKDEENVFNLLGEMKEAKNEMWFNHNS